MEKRHRQRSQSPYQKRRRDYSPEHYHRKHDRRQRDSYRENNYDDEIHRQQRLKNSSRTRHDSRERKSRHDYRKRSRSRSEIQPSYTSSDDTSSSSDSSDNESGQTSGSSGTSSNVSNISNISNKNSKQQKDYQSKKIRVKSEERERTPVVLNKKITQKQNIQENRIHNKNIEYTVIQQNQVKVEKDAHQSQDSQNQKQQNQQNQPIQQNQQQQDGKTGGAYIPPFKLRLMMQQIEDKNGVEYQRLKWDALRKSINGIVNKVNISNISQVLLELFSENIERGKGLLCRALIRAQQSSDAFTPVFASVASVVNSKFPDIGELLAHRVLTLFKRSLKRNDKSVAEASARFLAHLINQSVLHEYLALEIIQILMQEPTEDSIQFTITFCKEIGATLLETLPEGLNEVMDVFRQIAASTEYSDKVKYQYEAFAAHRRENFAKYPPIPEGLDLVEYEDKITHNISIEETKLDPQITLDIFKFDPDYQKHEEEYKRTKLELLGESDDEDGDDQEDGEEDESSEGEEDEEPLDPQEKEQMKIIDETGTNLVNLRRTIYLTIMNSLQFEEAGHKLLQIGIPKGMEIELVAMLIECCSQERTYLRFYGLLATRFCLMNRRYQELFEESFIKQYALIHMLETNKMRNIAKLYANILAADGISWEVIGCIRLTEEDTSSGSRIFIKFLFQELSELMGLVKLNERLNNEDNQIWADGVFPKDSPQNMRFAINFFTSIGLGGLTDTMRTLLKKVQVQMLLQAQAMKA